MNTVQQEKEFDPDEEERQKRIQRMPILEQCYNLMDFEAVARRVMYVHFGADLSHIEGLFKLPDIFLGAEGSPKTLPQPCDGGLSCCSGFHR